MRMKHGHEGSVIVRFAVRLTLGLGLGTGLGQ